MTAKVDNNVYFNGRFDSGGAGAITPVSPVDNTRKLPSQVYSDGQLFPLEIENIAAGESELSFCTLSSGLIVRGTVIDTSARTGALVGLPPYSPALNPITFSQTTCVCGVTVPAQFSVYLDENGAFAFGSPVRKTVFFQTMTGVAGARTLTDITNGEAVFVLGIAALNDGGGGVFVYNSSSSTAEDGYNVFEMTGAGIPGRLIRQRYEVAVNFFRDTLGVYADGTGVSRFKLHSLARGAAGAEDAWSGVKVNRGSDGAGAFTAMEMTDRDRQVAEKAFIRNKSYGNDNDVTQFLVPTTMPPAASKTNLVPGQFARATDDERLWYYDPQRGLAEILLSDGGPRARVANIAGLRALTPDGYQDGEVVLVDGATFRGDGDVFAVYWSSGTSTADNGFDVFKPNLHAGGAAWSEAGRFLALAPNRNIKFADSDATPDVSGGVLFQCADTPAPVTSFDGMRNGKLITVQPGIVATTFVHSATFKMPNGVNFTLDPGAPAVTFLKENGVVIAVGGAGAGGRSVATLAELKTTAANPDDIISMAGRAAAGDPGAGDFVDLDADYSSVLVFTTVAVSAINGTSEEITVTSHGIRTGDGFVPSAAAGGFAANTLYFANVVDENTITAHLTFEDAMAGTNKVNLSSASGFNLKFLRDPHEAVYVIRAGAAIDGSEGVRKRVHELGVYHLEWWPGTFDGVEDDALALRAAARLIHAVASEDPDAGAICRYRRAACESDILTGLVATSGMIFESHGPEFGYIKTNTDGVHLFKFAAPTDISTPPKGSGLRNTILESTVQYPTGGSLLSLNWINEPVIENIKLVGGYLPLEMNRVANPVFGEKITFFTGSRLGIIPANIRLHSDSATRSNSSLHFGQFDMLNGAPEKSRKTVTTNDDANDELVFGSAHGLSNGAHVCFPIDIAGVTAFDDMFARSVSSTRISLHPTRADAIAGTNKINLTASAGFDLVECQPGMPLVGVLYNNGDGCYVTAESHIQGVKDGFVQDPSGNSGAVRKTFSAHLPELYLDSCLRDAYQFIGDADNDYDYFHLGGEISTPGRYGVYVDTDDLITNLVLLQKSIRNCGHRAIHFANNNAVRPRIFVHELKDNNTQNVAAGGEVQLGGVDPIWAGSPHITSTTIGGSVLTILSGATGVEVDAPRISESPRTTKVVNNATLGEVKRLNTVLGSMHVGAGGIPASAPSVKGDDLVVCGPAATGMSIIAGRPGDTSTDASLYFGDTADGYKARFELDNETHVFDFEVENPAGEINFEFANNTVMSLTADEIEVIEPLKATSGMYSFEVTINDDNVAVITLDAALKDLNSCGKLELFVAATFYEAEFFWRIPSSNESITEIREGGTVWTARGTDTTTLTGTTGTDGQINVGWNSAFNLQIENRSNATRRIVGVISGN